MIPSHMTNCRSPCPWLTDLIVAQLIGKPRKKILVAQLISHNKKLGFIDGCPTGPQHFKAGDKISSEKFFWFLVNHGFFKKRNSQFFLQ